ncbi:flavin reductase family protein [Liquorilactobacillus satsumensis]|uniref:Uncharacterized protein n=1 Tax=Liquorilactobacillus satsumensis DSM 16230 = JCM 12392 TaxID=1423801 RepID=A0A0R1UYX9_9LACO|nr:flavin reductase [Liquorilactobacillus satsumensis]KRL98521.1 hypothetical protein FD50_GL000840 [Liquorilactobacillus satsumensis DSM 16230 = JCM 12392]MCC7667915.1 hypothetical protein [Liquorilactobacillus satsumensis]MCP9313911.1 flavin reductase [Liquorilactobacillus satsumensis]MCP9329326.1 flavin reductase [Liquorilactobacillus satsumensis]MCP9358647.1 flavin reductase [Liquorilactobacillus satsumensis]
MFKQLTKDSFYYGATVVLMTTKNPNTGIDNLTPLSSTWTLDQTIVFGIGLHNQGYLNLAKGTNLTFNIADGEHWQQVEKVAKTTGTHEIPGYKERAGYTYCADKFGLGNFTKLPGITGETVRIKECPLQLEATVLQITKRATFAIVECQIKAIFVLEDLLYDSTHIDVEKWHPLIYKFREYATTKHQLGKNFRFAEFSR